jgi:hypothetical protein
MTEDLQEELNRLLSVNRFPQPTNFDILLDKCDLGIE